MNKLLKSIKSNKEFIKYTLFFFVCLFLYNILVVNQCHLWSTDNITYPYHLVDFSFGFASKLLPGALYHLFFKEVYKEQLNVYLAVLLLVLYAFVALCLARIFTAQRDRQTKSRLLIVIFFFLTGPCTFAMFSQEFGILDMYCLLICALFLCVHCNKYLKYFVPLLFAAAVLVNYSCLLSFIVFMSVIMLYNIAHAEKKEKRTLYVILALSLLAAIGLTVYFVLFEKSNMVYSLEQFHEQLAARNRSGDAVNTYYYDFTFYDRFDVHGQNYDEFANLTLFDTHGSALLGTLNTILTKIYVLFTYVYMANPRYAFAIAFLAVLLAPLFAGFVRYWLGKCKQKKGIEKCAFILAILLLPLTLLSLLFSNDGVRWFTHALLIQFALYFYIASREKDFENLKTAVFARIPTAALLVYGAVYMFTVINPYP